MHRPEDRHGSARHLRLTGEVLTRTTFCYPDSCDEPTSFAVADRFAPFALVLDPSHRGTEVEAQARLLPCPLEWHDGFRLTIDRLRRRPSYRGQEYVDLGVHLAAAAGKAVLTPRILGDAARSGAHDQQSLKRVWHLLARFGREEGAA